MGFTHYWYLNPKGDQKKYNQALEDIKKIIKRNKSIIGDWQGNTPNNEIENKKSIGFNGIGLCNYN